MEILRRNTDYAIRMMVNLTRHWDCDIVSTRQLAKQEDIAYQLACKLMQKLKNAELVLSCMGPTGGFRLSREPSKITLQQIIEAVQGTVYLNKCMADNYYCSRGDNCVVRTHLSQMQDYINKCFSKTALSDLLCT